MTHKQKPWEENKTHNILRAGQKPMYGKPEGTFLRDCVPLAMPEWERAKACVNAMSGISDPEAFVKAADKLEMMANYNSLDRDDDWADAMENYSKARGGK